MNENGYDFDDRSPLEELDGPVREAVEEIVDGVLPKGAMRRAVGRFGAIGASPVSKWRRFRWARVAAAVAATVVVLVGICLLRTPDPREPPSPIVDVIPVRPGDEGVREEIPILQTYRLALRESPEALETLLDKHAVLFLPPGEQPLPLVSPAGRWDSSGHENQEPL